MLEFLSGQEEVGPSLHLHLLECIREIKHYLTNKHVGREVEKVGNYRTEVFPSLCSTAPKKSSYKTFRCSH